jgi:cell division protein FtsX
MAVMLLKPRGLFRSWQTRYPFLMHGFAACTIGAVAALAFNDSGIVAAATMIVYVAVPMLLLRLDETDE